MSGDFLPIKQDSLIKLCTENTKSSPVSLSNNPIQNNPPSIYGNGFQADSELSLSSSYSHKIPPTDFSERFKHLKIPATDAQKITDNELKKIKEELKFELQNSKKYDEKIINEILGSLNKDNYKAIQIFLKNFSNLDIKQGTNISIPHLFKQINEQNHECAEILFENPEILKNTNFLYNRNILPAIKQKNNKFAKKLCESEIFTKCENIKYIPFILMHFTDEISDFAEWICQNPDFIQGENISYIEDILEVVDKNNKSVAKKICQIPAFIKEDNIEELINVLRFLNEKNTKACELMLSDEEFLKDENIKDISWITSMTDEQNEEVVLKIIQDREIPIKYKASIIELKKRLDNNEINEKEILKKFYNYRERLLKFPNLYINGEIVSDKISQEKINSFFESNKLALMEIFSIFDKEAIDSLFRKRLNTTEKYLKLIICFNKKELNLLNKIVSCKDTDNKSLLPSQKIECIDLIDIFKCNKISFEIIENEINNGKIDWTKVKTELLKKFFYNCGYNINNFSDISKEKLLAWNLDYVQFLPKAKDYDFIMLNDLLYGSTLDDFMSFIHNKTNIYGQTNSHIRETFEKNNMDYNFWINPDKKEEIILQSKSNYEENLSEITNSLLEDINTLRNSSIKKIVDNKLKSFIKENDNLNIPDEILNNEEKTAKFISYLLSELKSVWQRANSNQNFSTKRKTALEILNIKKRLEQKLNILTKGSGSLTIKMWDRIPQKDIFQGHFSSCCLALNHKEGESMLHYLMNTTFNIIEIVDNVTGKTIGNALCYFVIDETNKPAFIIDNIEIDNAHLPSKQECLILRKNIFEYANRIAKKVTRNNSAKIYIGTNNNDVSTDDLKHNTKTVKLLGDTNSAPIYLDLFGDRKQKPKVECLSEE